MIIIQVYAEHNDYLIIQTRQCKAQYYGHCMGDFWNCTKMMNVWVAINEMIVWEEAST